MKIKINLKIFLFVIIFFITGQIKIYGILMFFAFIHELSHLITGILLKFRPDSLKIMPMGLSVSFKVLPKDYNTKVLNGNMLRIKKIIIAAAGPLSNFFIIILIVLLKNIFNSEDINLYIYSNLLIAIFNLLPIYPLDGGRIIKEIVTLKSGRKNSIIISNKISNICIIFLTIISSIAVYYYKNIAILFIIAYLWMLIIIQNRRDNIKIKIYGALEKEI